MWISPDSVETAILLGGVAPLYAAWMAGHAGRLTGSKGELTRSPTDGDGPECRSQCGFHRESGSLTVVMAEQATEPSLPANRSRRIFSRLWRRFRTGPQGPVTQRLVRPEPVVVLHVGLDDVVQEVPDCTVSRWCLRSAPWSPQSVPPPA